ncbi:MAG: HAD family hydrolase [Bacilli bacterium]|nr:HAD family hydrolase [Bacilli bacterium]
MQKFQLYLFDFDGTLFDTLPSSKYVFKKAYEGLGMTLDEEEVLGFTREPIPDSYQRKGAPKEKFDAFMADIEKYVNSQESVNLTGIYDDTYDTIIDLRMLEADLGIVTSNNVLHVRDVLRKFDMQKDFFTVLVGNREAPNPKPSPEPILKALEMINYKGDKKDVCYVGDSLNDCIAAVNAGIVPILLDRSDEYGNSSYQRIKSLKELLD